MHHTTFLTLNFIIDFRLQGNIKSKYPRLYSLSKFIVNTACFAYASSCIPKFEARWNCEGLKHDIVFWNFFITLPAVQCTLKLQQPCICDQFNHVAFGVIYYLNISILGCTVYIHCEYCFAWGLLLVWYDLVINECFTRSMNIAS